MNLIIKNKMRSVAIGAVVGVFVISILAFVAPSQAAPTEGAGTSIPLGEQQVSPPEAQNETAVQKGFVQCGLKDGDPCTFCDFFGLFNTITNWVIFVIVPTIAVLFIVFGGFMLATSRGNPNQLQKGKDMLIWTFAGIAIIFVSWMVLNSLLSGIGVMKWTGLTGENGDFETHFSDGRLWDADRSGDKIWKEDEWNGFTIEINHPNFSEPQIRRILDTATNTLFVDRPLVPYTQENLKLQYKIGGWWQFSCGL